MVEEVRERGEREEVVALREHGGVDRERDLCLSQISSESRNRLESAHAAEQVAPDALLVRDRLDDERASDPRPARRPT